MREYTKDVSQAREPAFGADFVLPLFQSVVTGVLVAGLVAVAGGGSEAFWPVFFAVALVAWVWTLSAAREALWKLESVLERDIDADGAVGVPEPARPVVRVEVEAGRTLQLVDFHGLTDVAQLHSFARLALSGDLNERHVKQVLKLARSDWQALRDDLVGRGLLAWNNANSRKHGVTVTRSGADVLSGVLDTERLLVEGDHRDPDPW